MALKVDVIIPTWNSARGLEAALGSIEREVRPSRIIVVDRESTDGTREMALSHGCVLIDDTTSLGSARTKGIRASETEWILFVDDDVILPPGYMARMEAHIDERTGALWSPCISVVEPLRSHMIEMFEGNFQGRESYVIGQGDRGFTNSTLVRRELIEGIELSDMTTWEDWAIAQQVMGSGMEWKVAKVYSDHNHREEDFFYKASWNTAGVLNLGRTGRKTVRWSLAAYAQHVRKYASSIFQDLVVRRDSARLKRDMMLLLATLYAPRHLISTRRR